MIKIIHYYYAGSIQKSTQIFIDPLEIQAIEEGEERRSIIYLKGGNKINVLIDIRTLEDKLVLKKI